MGRKKDKRRFSAYKSRNRLLLTLGFASYREYTESPLWREIRDRVLASPTCCGCNGKASQVHHSRYTPNNLKGTSLEFLHPICNKCHEHIEFKGKRKCSLEEANERLRRLRGEVSESPAKVAKQKRCKKNRQQQNKPKRATVADFYAGKTCGKGGSGRGECGLLTRWNKGRWISYESSPIEIPQGTPVRIRQIRKPRQNWKHCELPESITFYRAVSACEGYHVFSVGQIFIEVNDLDLNHGKELSTE